MTEKTKRKIDAMARKHNEALRYFENASFSNVYENGATPWAEWCERFENKMEEALGYIRSKGHHGSTELGLERTLKEYRRWLEDVDGRV